MAIPVAVTGGSQTFDFADLPTLVTLDGSASYDPDGDPITAYAWTTLEVPDGSSAALDDATAVSPTFTADLPGTYLFLLQVTADGDDSETSTLEAPSTAYCAVTVRTEHLALSIPATAERDWGPAVQEALAAVDTIKGELDTHAADNTLHPEKATKDTYGTVRLSADPSPGDPVAISKTDPKWETLTEGGDADGMHSHPSLEAGASPGRHHDLRPDLLVGANDLTWTTGQIAALTRSSNVGGTRAVHASAENADGILQVDIEKANNLNLAGVLWNAPAGNWQAIIDLRIGFDGEFMAQDLAQNLHIGFGWQPNAALGAPSHLLGVGLVLNGWGFRAARFGITDPDGAGDTTDWNGGIGALTPVVETGLLTTEFFVRLRRVADMTYGDIGFGGGGYVQIGAWSEPSAAGKFCIFGGLKRAGAGIKIKSTGFRIKTADKWFGA